MSDSFLGIGILALLPLPKRGLSEDTTEREKYILLDFPVYEVTARKRLERRKEVKCASTYTKDGVAMREEICSIDVDLLAVSVGSNYLPRELSQICICAVYCPPKTDIKVAWETITETEI